MDQADMGCVYEKRLELLGCYLLCTKLLAIALVCCERMFLLVRLGCAQIVI